MSGLTPEISFFVIWMAFAAFRVNAKRVFVRALEKARGEKLVRRRSKKVLPQSWLSRSTESCKLAWYRQIRADERSRGLTRVILQVVGFPPLMRLLFAHFYLSQIRPDSGPVCLPP